MKRAALYMRVSTVDQHPENQLNELRRFAELRGFQIAEEYTDHGVSGTKARRPALDRMLKDAHRRKFDVVVVWACDRLARSTKHFLQVLEAPSTSCRCSMSLMKLEFSFFLKERLSILMDPW